MKAESYCRHDFGGIELDQVLAQSHVCQNRVLKRRVQVEFASLVAKAILLTI